jgi:hypothetical protein
MRSQWESTHTKLPSRHKDTGKLLLPSYSAISKRQAAMIIITRMPHTPNSSMDTNQHRKRFVLTTTNITVMAVWHKNTP